MKITWLGQAGIMLKTAGKTIIVDPYLSNSVEKINPKNYRRFPIAESYLSVKPDVLLLTHDHLDHTDPETLPHYLHGGGVEVLAPYNAWQTARKLGGDNNFVMLSRHTVWHSGDVRFEAVKAEHSDLLAIGVIISSEGKNIYITGDTLYNREVIEDVKAAGLDIDVVILPINGVGNNMNCTDAFLFANDIGAECAIPVHYGLFDEMNADGFNFENKRTLKIYTEEEL